MQRKKRYQLYHRKELDWSLLLGGAPEQVVQADYFKVADVRADDLEEVFCLTNHVGEAPWWQHPQVKPVASQPAYRSTSVGDVVQQGRRMWLVKDMGYAEITWMNGEGRAIARRWRKLTTALHTFLPGPSAKTRDQRAMNHPDDATLVRLAAERHCTVEELQRDFSQMVRRAERAWEEAEAERDWREDAYWDE
jgi:hypothetical protein